MISKAKRLDARKTVHRTGSSTQRGYGYDWQRFRAKLLREADFVLCRDCLDAGRCTPTDELHHIVPVRVAPERRKDRTNIMGLCKLHHSIRTARGE